MAQSNTIGVTPSSLTFCVAANNSPAPPAQTLTVSATGGTPVGFNANAFPGWVRLNGTAAGTSIIGNTNTQNTITVTIDPSGYAGQASGSAQSGTIQISAGNVLTVPVSVNITPSCNNATNLTATPSSVSLSPTQTSQAVTISGPAGSTITATPNYGANNPTGWFTLNTTSLTPGQMVTVSLAPNANLLSGTTGSILFTQNGTNNSISESVTFTSTTGTGNGVFTATPASFNPSFTNSQSPAQSQTFTINGPPAVLTATTSPGTSGWLSVTQPGGTTPPAITVTVNPASLPTGTTSGSVTVTQNGTPNNFVVIPINATVGAGAYSFSPNPFNFSVQGGSSTSSTQTLTITGPNNTPVSTTVQVNNGGYQWLNVTSGGTLTNSTLQLLATVNPVNLAPNMTFTGTIGIVAGNQTVLTIPVTVTTSGVPTLTFTPMQLSFAWQTGTPTPPTPQTIIVTSPAGTQVNFTPSQSTTNCGANWLVVSPATTTATNGMNGTPITVSINTQVLPMNTTTTCTGNIQVSAPGASNPNTTIPVSLLVSINPLLVVSPTSLTFNSQPGSGVPSAQTINVTSSTSTTSLPFTYTVTPSPAGSPNFLTVTQSATGTPAMLTVAINPSILAGLAPNTYTDNLVLTSTAAGNPTITIPVTLTVANTATLVANPPQITMNYQIGQPTPPVTQTVTVSSTGAPITFSAAATPTNCGSFFTVSPTSGLTTLTASGQNGTPINVMVPNIAGLTTAQTCTGTVTLTPTNSTTTPTTVNVTLNVVNQPVINVGANSITQTAPAGSTTPIKVNVPLSSTDNATLIGLTATVGTSPQGQQWLSIQGSNSLTTSAANLTVQLDPTNLAPGTYTGTVTIQDTRPNSPVQTQMIPVTFVVAAQVTANPSSLTFTTAINGPNPATQTITVGGVPSTSTVGATPSTSSCGAGWLTATASGNTVTVGVTTANLAVSSPTTCLGNVAINVPGATPNPLNVSVTLNVTNTVLALSPTSVSFSAVAGSTTPPASQTVQLTATNTTGVPYTATFTPATSATPAGLVTISPTTGTTSTTTPATLTIGVAPSVLSTLQAGTYGGTVTVSSPNLASVTLNVTVTVTQPPPPALTSVVNSATLQPGAVSPGEIITIFGTNIGPATPVGLTLTSAGKVATTLGGTQVFFDSFAAPLIYVSATQINAIVPYEINGRTTTKVTITSNSITSSGLTLNVTDSSPGIFTTTQNGTGQGAILNQNGSVNSSTNPAPKGSVIQIYATGEGALNPPGVTGSVTTGLAPFPRPVDNVSLSFLVPNTTGGPATPVPATILYAGEAPTLVSGVLQVNAVVPSSVPSGPVTVVLTVGANSSPSVVTVSVQ